jgi:alginate O-acetyltransferase complex protein AlgI
MAGASSAEGLHQPVARYLTQQAAWSLGVGTLLSAPFWPWFKGRAARIATASPAGLRGTVEISGAVLEIAWFSLLFFLSAVWLAGDTYNPFIYFRF